MVESKIYPSAIIHGDWKYPTNKDPQERKQTSGFVKAILNVILAPAERRAYFISPSICAGNFVELGGTVSHNQKAVFDLQSEITTSNTPLDYPH